MSDLRELPFGLMSAKEHASGLKPYSNMGIAAGLVIDAVELIEQQQQTVTKQAEEIEHLKHIMKSHNAVCEDLGKAIMESDDLCNALNDVLNDTSVETWAQAVAVLDRVRGETK